MMTSVRDKQSMFFVAILLIVVSAFAADVLDLREELRILSCTTNLLDNNVTTGLTNNTPLEAKPILTFRSLLQRKSAETPSLPHPTSGSRAPPSLA